MDKLTLFFIACVLTGGNAFGMGYGVSTTRLASGQTVNVLRLEGQVAVMEWRGWQVATMDLDPTLDTIVFLTSPGGNASHGLFLLGKVDDFQEEWRKHGRKVVVVAERDCSSMCVPLYYAFENRLAITGTRFGLHAVHTELGPDPDFTRSYIQSLTDRADARDDQDMLDWVHRKEAQGAFATAKLDATSADELALEHSGIVQADAVVADEAMAFARAFPGR